MTLKDPETEAHTNSIEGTWLAIKRSLRNHAAHVEGEFDHYLAEYMLRCRRGHSMADDVFREFLRAITTLYPPMEKDVPSVNVRRIKLLDERHLNDFTRGRINGKIEEDRSVAADIGITLCIVARFESSHNKNSCPTLRAALGPSNPDPCPRRHLGQI
ncbi:hypothetical protein TNCV_418721 [Trichonephila clavipes]|nr:hypothetical protein TNCV_418721 [Trichonephila clavipes]